MLRFHGSEDKQTFTEVGYNSRLDELQAAILLELRPLRRQLERRAASPWPRATRSSGWASTSSLPAVAPGARHVYHLYMVRTQDRDGLVSGLSEAGIGTAVYYSTPLHRQPVFAHLGYAEGSLPVTERCARECLALPMSPTLGEAAQREVVQTVASLSPART